MNAVIVNISDVVEYRVDMIYDFLTSRGWDVKVLASDYMHIEKRKRVIKKENYIAINTLPYKKNLSLKRLYSHYDYAKKAKKILAKMEFDLLYIIVPANSLADIAKDYYKKGNVKIIIDIMDLWPESLPIKGTGYFPFTLWANIRNRNLQYADYIITECDLYQEILKKWLIHKNVKTLYWCHKKKKYVYEETCSLPEQLTLCYLGSVNNIIDIPKIAEFVRRLSAKQKITVKLIAAGERKQEFVKELETAGAQVIDYGKLYDAQEKKAIIDTCHYGINIMKPTVYVGISMKSVDYLEMGLPIINSLEGDLGKLIREYDCGVNIYEDGWEEKILQNKDLQKRRNAVMAFREKFSCEAFYDKLSCIVDEVMSSEQ